MRLLGAPPIGESVCPLALTLSPGRRGEGIFKTMTRHRIYMTPTEAR
jgi:hypothetical protein